MNEVSENIIAIKEISPQLEEALRFGNLFSRSRYGYEWKRIETQEGPAIFFLTVHWEKSVGICLNIASAGSTYPPHQHEGMETFFVYKGELIFAHNGKEVRIKAGEKPYYFNGLDKHSGFCEENTEFVAITCPADESWRPDERRHKRDF